MAIPEELFELLLQLWLLFHSFSLFSAVLSPSSTHNTCMNSTQQILSTSMPWLRVVMCVR